MKLPRLMIAGSGSGCGKTTITCGLLRLLQRKGLRPSSFKCGPDYIDPLYHREVLGINSRNLDSFFSSESQLRENLCRGFRNGDIAVIEGVMGYYDGLGMTTRTSCAEIADLTHTPVLLVLDAAGRSSSVLAELQGFLNYREEGRWIAGVIFNRLSPMLYEDLASEAAVMGVKPCGYLKRDDSHRFESRHLGLTLPEERDDFQEEVDTLADRLAQTIDMEAVISLAKTAEDIEEQTGDSLAGDNIKIRTGSMPAAGSAAAAPRIALARDAAFCFYYTENTEYLESLGCRIIPFSPLRDTRIPDCDGLILSGGYPELYARQLSENRPMLESVRKAVLAGLPTIAECGGYLCLHEELTDADGNRYPMAGVIPAKCHFAGFQRQFGYVTMTTLRDGVFGKEGTSCRGHEFHYYVSDSHRQDVLCEKPDGRRKWRGGMVNDSLYAGFTHLWLPSGPEAVRGFEEFYSAIDFVREYKCLQERTESMERLKIWKDQIAPWDRSAAQEARVRWDSIAKPLDGLGDLEKIITDIAGMQGSANVELSPAALYVFCADNGIVNEGVTQTDASVTAAVARNMVKGQSAVCLMARRAGVEVCPADVGMIEDVDGIRTCKVRKGTSDFLVEPSMSRSETVQTMQFGYDLAAEAARRGIRILAAGEMGIGNTTTGAAIASVLLDLPVDKVCGRGAGLDDAGLMRKRQVIAQGIDKYGFSQEAARSRDEEPAMTRDEVLRALSRLGGLDMAAMCGLYIGAACHRIPVIIDGAISAAAALTASMLIPGVSRYMVASHVGKEPAMPYLLEALGKSPVISADLALGEGTGAVMLVPLLEMALSVYRDGIHFSGLNMEPYRRYDVK